MTLTREKKCPQCGQRLRIPDDVGGLVMLCPNCGEKILSDFKIGIGRKVKRKSLTLRIFELPTTILQYLRRLLSGR